MKKSAEMDTLRMEGEKYINISKHCKRGRAKILSLKLEWMLYFHYYDSLSFEKEINVPSFQTLSSDSFSLAYFLLKFL